MATDLKAEQERIEQEVAGLERELEDLGDAASQVDRDSVKDLRARISATGAQIKTSEKKLALLKAATLRDRPSYEALTVEMPKWRTTILLGINSAAMVAVMDKGGLPQAPLIVATLLFLGGALAALSSGSVLERVGHSGLELADEVSAANFDDPDFTPDDLDRALKVAKSLASSTVWAELLRFFSLCLFAGGVLWAVFHTQ